MEDYCLNEAIPPHLGLRLIGVPLLVLQKFIPVQPVEKRILQFSHFPFALNGERPSDRSGKRKRGEKTMGGKMEAGNMEEGKRNSEVQAM